MHGGAAALEGLYVGDAVEAGVAEGKVVAAVGGLEEELFLLGIVVACVDEEGIEGSGEGGTAFASVLNIKAAALF